MGTQRTELSYDGMSRRTKITEFTNGTITSKKLYFWLGGSIACERDGLQTGFPLTKRYFGQGEVRGTTKLYYTFDHLGSIRELVDAAGAVQAEYHYSTYGERTKTSGNLDSDWGYAGLWHHQASGLDLATYRAYDAANKRWISRDPLGEEAGLNLYGYCGNSPINCVDPSGLLLRDASGKLIFTPDGTYFSGSQKTADGKKVQLDAPLEGGYLVTNDGKHHIQAYRYTGKKKKFKTNCLGHTFGDGEFWIFPDQAGPILDGDRYSDVTNISDAKGGDVVIYDTNHDGAALHSMTVLPAPPYANGRVIGKNGAGPVYIGPIYTNQITDKQANGPLNMFRRPGLTPSVFRP